MRVNSACMGVFSNRLAVSSCITIVVLATFLITSSFTKHPNRDVRAKQVNLMIRQIGHQLLMQAADSTSRVLPVTEIKEGTFQLRFENEFIFNHDSLMVLSQRLLPKTEFPSGYTITVHECLTSDIVYGFQLNKTSPDITPCRHRNQPSGCYVIEIAFPDLYEKIEQEQKAEQKQNLEQKEEDLRPKKFTTTFQGLSSIASRPGQAYSVANLVFSGMLLLLGVTLLIGRFRKISKPQPSKESVPEFAALGKFLFDVKDQRLLLGGEVVSLTGKEGRILELLNRNFGELIPRETLMQEVWINEGVITGRSLDMFVSKLRKKLSGDPDLRITNVHGKGYKLETSGHFQK